MELIKCAMIASDNSVVKNFEDFIRRIPSLSYYGNHATIESSLQLFYKKKIQLFFIYIDKDLAFYELLKDLNPVPSIIFIAPTDKWAIDSYRLGAVDYLLTDSSFTVFLSAVIKVIRMMNNTSVVNLLGTSKTENDSVDFICIKSEYQLYRINLDDIYAIEAMGDYVRIFINGLSKPLLSLLKLSKVEKLLPSSDFMRVHRSFIVHKKYISEISLDGIQVNGMLVPVGSTYRPAVKDYVSQLDVLNDDADDDI